MNNNKITLAITSHGDRTQWIKRTLDNVSDDPKIKEVVIRDDGSSNEDYTKLYELSLKHKKVRTFTRMKTGSSFYAKMDIINYLIRFPDVFFAILLDSDNVIDKSYVQSLCLEKWDTDTIYCPERAGQWSFENFIGVNLNRENVSKILKSKLRNDLILLLNVGNYFLNIRKYCLYIKDVGFDPQAADGIYVNRIMIQNGANLKVVPGMQYEHTVHVGSTYLAKAKESSRISDEQVKIMETW
jgi:hypothetical protein